MNEELRSCPFCGGKAEVMYAVTDDGTKTISVVCQKCSIGIFRARTRENDWNAWEKPERAIEAWNRRAVKHGRLIDADAFAEYLRESAENFGTFAPQMTMALEAAARDLVDPKKTPTIVEAEGEEVEK